MSDSEETALKIGTGEKQKPSQIRRSPHGTEVDDMFIWKPVPLAFKGREEIWEGKEAGGKYWERLNDLLKAISHGEFVFSRQNNSVGPARISVLKTPKDSVWKMKGLDIEIRILRPNFFQILMFLWFTLHFTILL